MSTQAAISKLSDPELFRKKAFINNEWVDSDVKFSVYDPATSQVIDNVADLGAIETREAIRHASNAFKTWSRTTAKERYILLKKWSDAIRIHQQDLATILTLENGKTKQEALGEIGYSSTFFEWFSEEAIRSYSQVIPSIATDQRSITIKQPIGVVGVVTPWKNAHEHITYFPSASVVRKVSAALAAGCTVVIKPSDETPYSVLALCELAKRVGIPAGVVNVITTLNHVSEVGRELCTNPSVRKISFTGSTQVGKLLMEQSSSTMKKVSMELGGNAPFIVFDDADIDAAIQGLMKSKFRGAGQVCVSPNRIFVQKGIYQEFAQRFAEKVRAIKVGNGFEEGTNCGPLINKKAVAKVHSHVKDAIENGATALVGGNHLGDNFFEPTVLTGMKKYMRVFNEETFGPVAALFEFSTEEEVIELANDTPYGLAAYFYSRDIGRVWRVSEALQSGMVGANSTTIDDVSTPFGGLKESGMGKEGSSHGLDDYLTLKYINMGGI
ncbi:succinate-semialdehyde dehydrogenase [Spinellus fusiger]|nr:succinate-semialdehyde dehydrogenase [Spinellus fusiger]